MSAFLATKRLVKDFISDRKLIKAQSGERIQFYNCWDQKNEDMYWRQFIEHHHLLDDCPDSTIAFFSVFGNRRLIGKVKAGAKVFYSAENLKRDVFSAYADHCLGNKDIALAMGYEYFENERYIRFPLWMDYMFDPWLTENEIRAKCQELRFPLRKERIEKSKFCCMVASNPGDGLRTEMFNLISKISHVDSSGRLLHNDDSLKLYCCDNKMEYLSRYCFNICPENTNADGYVSEKIFESIACGCIPVYWGSNQNPEPCVINKDAIILWDRKTMGEDAICKIGELFSSKSLLKEYLSQPRLNNCAEEYVLDTFSSVRVKLEQAIKNI